MLCVCVLIYFVSFFLTPYDDHGDDYEDVLEQTKKTMKNIAKFVFLSFHILYANPFNNNKEGKNYLVHHHNLNVF